MVQRGTQRRRPGGRRYFPRRKVCAFCVDKITHIDYKDASRLRRYISDWGKIDPRRKTGTCAPHQRALTQAIKRARFLALLPFTGAHTLIELGRPEGPRSDRFRAERRDRVERRAPQPEAKAENGATPGAVAVEEAKVGDAEAAQESADAAEEAVAPAAEGEAAAEAEAPQAPADAAEDAEAPAAEGEAAAEAEAPQAPADAVEEAEAPAAEGEAAAEAEAPQAPADAAEEAEAPAAEGEAAAEAEAPQAPADAAEEAKAEGSEDGPDAAAEDKSTSS